jgi:hypothetical protein
MVPRSGAAPSAPWPTWTRSPPPGSTGTTPAGSCTASAVNGNRSRLLRCNRSRHPGGTTHITGCARNPGCLNLSHTGRFAPGRSRSSATHNDTPRDADTPPISAHTPQKSTTNLRSTISRLRRASAPGWSQDRARRWSVTRARISRHVGAQGRSRAGAGGLFKACGADSSTFLIGSSPGNASGACPLRILWRRRLRGTALEA